MWKFPSSPLSGTTAGWLPPGFMLSQLWIGSHVRPLKNSMPNMAISFLSATVYQCHTGLTMQNPFWLSAPLPHEYNPSTPKSFLSTHVLSIVKGRLCSVIDLFIYLFVTGTQINMSILLQNKAGCQKTYLGWRSLVPLSYLFSLSLLLPHSWLCKCNMHALTHMHKLKSNLEYVTFHLSNILSMFSTEKVSFLCLLQNLT